MNPKSYLERDQNYLLMMKHPRMCELARIVDFPNTIEAPQPKSIKAISLQLN